MEANEYLLQENKSDRKEDDNDHHNPPSGNGSGDSGKTEETENKGTLTIDATCAPVYIRYPQDVSHLNEAKEKLEEIGHDTLLTSGLIEAVRYYIENLYCVNDAIDYIENNQRAINKMLKSLPKILEDSKGLQGLMKKHG